MNYVGFASWVIFRVHSDNFNTLGWRTLSTNIHKQPKYSQSSDTGYAGGKIALYGAKVAAMKPCGAGWLYNETAARAFNFLIWFS